jgi:hypothetical protein
MIKSSLPKMDLTFEDGILVMTVFPDVHLEVDDYKLMIEERKKMVGDEPFGVIADARAYHTATREVRPFVAKINPPGQVGVAILTESLALRLMANFYMNIDRPACPTRMVKDMDEAKAWLKLKLLERKEMA